MEAFLALVNDFGCTIYLLLFAYCALKSGSLPLFAGYAAQIGALDIGAVAVATFAGGYLGDEVRFAAARRYGKSLGEGRPRIARLIKQGRELLARYGKVYIFLYRYPKGMRTIGALPVGLTDMPWPEFTILNATSAALWATILLSLGYIFGQSIEHAIATNWNATSVLFLILFIAAVIFAWWWAKRSSHEEKRTEQRDKQP